MRDNHITEILDQTPLADLPATELSAIRAHLAICVDCARAFKASQISSLLIKARTSEAAENVRQANPFFQTRVLAAWRERQGPAAGWSLRRLWNATGALVASMAVTTAALAVLTFVVPGRETANQQVAAVLPSSAESIVFDQDQTDNQMTNDQVISAIYADDDEGK